jgi:hypothetical protein
VGKHSKHPHQSQIQDMTHPWRISRRVFGKVRGIIEAPDSRTRTASHSDIPCRYNLGFQLTDLDSISVCPPYSFMLLGLVPRSLPMHSLQNLTSLIFNVCLLLPHLHPYRKGLQRNANSDPRNNHTEIQTQ